jgi:SAM-dependent methyltransferase
MTEYVWQHGLTGEPERLRLMSQILDPACRDHLARLPLASDWRCVEIGAGNGSLSEWLATRLGDGGRMVATDISPELLQELSRANLEVRALDIVKDGLEPEAFDLVVTRALLHHLPERMDVMATMVRALRPGGWIFIMEPDFYPTLIVEPEGQASFWRDFLAWSAKKQIDYFVGRTVAPRLQELGIETIASEGHAIQYRGGSVYARWWQLGISEVAERLLDDGATTKGRLDQFFALNDDPNYWTQTIAFTAVSGCKLR